MVRIRSDRWYSGENQKELRRVAPSNSGGTRRLVSLVFLLALVIVLMAKVSDPNNMRRAFESLGVPMERQVVARSEVDPLKSEITPRSNVGSRSEPRQLDPSQQNSDESWEKTCSDLIPQLIDKASPEQINHFAEFWFSDKPQFNREKTKIEMDFDSTALIEPMKAKLNPTEHGNWLNLLDKFDERWKRLMLDIEQSPQGADKSTSKEPTDEFHRYLSKYLDQRLLTGLRDASPWTAVETTSFGRLLQRGKKYQFGTTDPPLVSSKQLDTDFKKLRGSWVRYRATVRLIEAVNREQPLVGQDSYSVLWLRGFDGSTQPVAVYTTSSIVNQLKRAMAPQEFPEIEVIGLVGKKLAYSASTGAEVAPTLFAGSIVQFAPDERKQLVAQNGPSSQQIGVTALAALVFGLLAMAFVWRQLRPKASSRSTRRLFELFVGLALVSGMLQNRSMAQDPPWKSTTTENEAKAQSVEQRLESTFDENEMQQIQAIIDGNDTGAPNSILRAMLYINQVGWNAVWKSGASIRLTEQSQLRPEELEGRVWSVQSLKLSPKQSDWFSTQPVKDIYRIQVQPTSAKDQQPPQLISVFCREVPSLWKYSAQLKQPIQLRCFSFRRTTTSEQEANPEAMFYLAERVSWKLSPSDLEESAELHPTIPDRWVELAKVGWDLSWFDTLAANNQKRLSNDEAEPLLKMLQITKAEGNRQPAANMMVSAIDSMKKPVDNLAAAIDWQIRLVSGSLVDITRDGVESKYYQLDGFAKIPNQTVNYTIPDTGQSITFTNEFPVTIVTLFDKQYIPLDRLEAGEKSWQIGKTVQVQGRFLRLWSYESQRLSSPQSQSQSRQVAPLVAAGHLREANLLPEVSRTSLWSVALMGCAMLSVMVWVLSNFFKKSTRSTGRLKNP